MVNATISHYDDVAQWTCDSVRYRITEILLSYSINMKVANTSKFGD